MQVKSIRVSKNVKNDLHINKKEYTISNWKVGCMPGCGNSLLHQIICIR